MTGTVLVVEPDEDLADLFVRTLALDGRAVVSLASLDEFDRVSDDCRPDLCLATTTTSAEADAVGQALGDRWPTCELVQVVDTSSRARKRELDRARIRHFVRPFQIEDLRDLVDRLLARKSSERGAGGPGAA